MSRRARVEAAHPKVLRDTLGNVCMVVYGPGSAREAAHRKLVELGHLALPQGLSFECAKCSRSAAIVTVAGAAPGMPGYELRGLAAEEHCS